MNLQPENRRQFLSRSLTGAVLAGTGWAYWNNSTQSKRVTLQQESSPVEEPEPMQIATHARRARKIAIDRDNQLFVIADRKISGYHANGERLTDILLPRPARCISTTHEGNLLVGVFDHLEMYSQQGKKLIQWDAPTADSIIGGVTSTTDYVFLADAGTQVIWKYNWDGELLDSFGQQSRLIVPAEFFAITSSHNDKLHLVNPGRHRVETVSLKGEILSQWGQKSRSQSGFSGCCNPVGLSVMADGRFVTAERGLPAVKLFSADGEFTSQLLGPEMFSQNAELTRTDDAPGCRSGGLDIAIDTNERLCVLDRVTGIIHRVNML